VPTAKWHFPPRKYGTLVIGHFPLFSQEQNNSNEEETQRLKNQIRQGNEYVKKQREGFLLDSLPFKAVVPLSIMFQSLSL
jgi:hypothetical protein